MAAVKANGQTTIENAAREPEIIDLVTFLNSMGARIRGAGTDVIRIDGVDSLSSNATHTIIPDRIEAGTYLSLAASVGNGIQINNIIPEHLESFNSKLLELGVDLDVGEDSIYVPESRNLHAIEIKTNPFPGFATDLQQPITPALMKAQGSSVIVDTIYPKRVKHISQLQKMGANIRVENDIIIVAHTEQLHGAEVEAGEIRAGAALMIAGLMASGTTIITKAENILRGYDRIVYKLKQLGANIEIVSDEEEKVK